MARSAKELSLLRRQPHRPPRAHQGRVRRPHLPRPALQQPPGLQRPLRRKGRHPLQFPDHGLRRHLGVEHGRRSRLRGDRRARRQRLRRHARLPHLPRPQRHDGLSRHDGPASNRTSPRAERDGIDLSALRSDSESLSEDVDGRGVRAAAPTERNNMGKDHRKKGSQAVRPRTRHHSLLLKIGSLNLESAYCATRGRQRKRARPEAGQSYRRTVPLA